MTNPIQASRKTHDSRPVHEIIILVAATILLVALGYAVSSVLSPFVLLGSLIYLLYPLRENPLPQRMLWLAVFLFVLWFMDSLSGLLAPFIVAFLLAYILNPVVTHLSRRLPRWAASLFVVLLLLSLCVGCFFFMIPVAIDQFQSILTGIRLIAQDLAGSVESGALFDILSGYGIPVERSRELIAQQLAPRLEGLLTALFQGLFGFVTSISSIALHLINIVIIPFLVLYLLMDFPLITDRFHRFAPVARRTQAAEMARKIDKLLGRYFRGAIIVAVIQGTISATGLWLIGVPYALILGIMTGILNFIPYVGLITSLVVSSVVALFSGEPVAVKVAEVIVLYLSQKLLEATVLGPKIIGTQVGLHPVMLILCLFVFGYFLGFVGLLIAVPATALILAGMKEWEEKHDRLRSPAKHQET